MKNLQTLFNRNLHFNKTFCFRVTGFEKHLPIIYEFMKFFEREKNREADREKDRNGEGGREEGREGEKKEEGRKKQE